MTVFHYEWKRSRKYILIWGLSLAVCIFSMIPVYYSMIETPELLPKNIAEGGFFETVGISLALLLEPLGMYGFLNAFFALAGGIFGMHFALSLFTKECTENTAEYLFTKPCGRIQIYKGKVLCLLVGTCITSAAYILASFIAMIVYESGFSMLEFILLAGSFPLVTLIFGGMGVLLGCWHPNNRSPLLTASLAVFMGYCITAFSRTIGSRIISYLSPFSFFHPAHIHENSFYEWDYFLWYVLLLTVFFFLSRKILMKKDIKLAV